MSHATKRVIGNVSVLTALVALVAVLVFAATSPTFLKNDAELTAEANVGTPIVQAMNTPKPKPTATAKPTPTTAVDKSQAWADDMINLLLNGNSKSSFDDFSPKIAHHYIESWSQPNPGVLSINVKDKNWSNCDLDALGMNVLDTAGWDNPKLKLVEVSDGNSKPRIMERNNEYAVPNSCA